eukprot:TRINITY_DN93848_c0_g1_i1.p1 TRINITY_DN93848_c0_g1~~TRINITY_DN93848_c0_g1_i1.p1  ORF type:complete len:305 (+),score=10.08 TRINITY_DN93848_c0_g1_i1:71-985(+)
MDEYNSLRTPLTKDHVTIHEREGDEQVFYRPGSLSRYSSPPYSPSTNVHQTLADKQRDQLEQLKLLHQLEQQQLLAQTRAREPSPELRHSPDPVHTPLMLPPTPTAAVQYSPMLSHPVVPTTQMAPPALLPVHSAPPAFDMADKGVLWPPPKGFDQPHWNLPPDEETGPRYGHSKPTPVRPHYRVDIYSTERGSIAWHLLPCVYEANGCQRAFGFFFFPLTWVIILLSFIAFIVAWIGLMFPFGLLYALVHCSEDKTMEKPFLLEWTEMWWGLTVGVWERLWSKGGCCDSGDWCSCDQWAGWAH